MVNTLNDKKGNDQVDNVSWAGSTKTFDEIINEIEGKYANRKWYEKFWDWIWFKVFYPLRPNELRWRYTRVECFFRRGANGWSYIDAWNFFDYLARVISEGTRYIKDVHHGWPESAGEKDWPIILEKIAKTFDYARKIGECDLIFIRRADYATDEEYQEAILRMEELSKERPNIWRLMTKEEIAEYDEGWDLFKKYFFSLWD